MKFGQFMSHYKRKNFIKKFCKNCSLKTSSKPFCVCKELSTASIGKCTFWSKLLILDLLKQSYRNLSKSACWPTQIPFYRGFFENKKGPGTIFQVRFFTEFFAKKFNFVTLHKLAKFHYQTAFTSQVIQ